MQRQLTEAIDDPAATRARALAHLQACRARILQFVATHYSLRGALRLNRAAFGRDILVAPVNFLMALPNFLLYLTALLLEQLSAYRLAHWLLCHRLEWRTTVQRRVHALLLAEWLQLEAVDDRPADPARTLLAVAAREPVAIYLHTRLVAADIFAGTIAGLAGLLMFSQFTPGSISSGTALANLWAREQAAADFVFGDYFGQLWYRAFPVEPEAWMVALSLLATFVTLAVVSAFAGLVTDPVQKWTGLHTRRLRKLCDAIERAMANPQQHGFRPKDTLLGRAYDLVDWIKGLFTL